MIEDDRCVRIEERCQRLREHLLLAEDPLEQDTVTHRVQAGFLLRELQEYLGRAGFRALQARREARHSTE